MQKGEFYIDPDSWFIYKCSQVFDEGVVLYKVNPNGNERGRVIRAYDKEDPFLKTLERVSDEHLRSTVEHKDKSIAWYENKISELKHVRSIFENELERRKRGN